MALLGPEESRPLYHSWANRIWEWIRGSGLINAHGLVNDGLDEFSGHNSICMNNNQSEWTYNQGVMLGGLAFLWELEPDPQLMQVAARMIDATLEKMVHDELHGSAGKGVLRESCEGNWMDYRECSQDAVQFKGVFIRYLGLVLDLAHRKTEAGAALGGSAKLARWAGFVLTNAESIWNRAACTSAAPASVGESREVLAIFGSSWIGPCNTVPGGLTAVAQTSAMDVLLIQMQLACRSEMGANVTTGA